MKFEPIDVNSLYNTLIENNNRSFNEFKKLLETFLSLFKSNGYKVEMIRKMGEGLLREKNSFLKERHKLFLSIFEGLYVHYQKALKDTGTIDFNDMINLATDLVKTGKVEAHYRYIIIDEYQDISCARCRLIKEIREVCHGKIMAVIIILDVKILSRLQIKKNTFITKVMNKSVLKELRYG